MRPHISIRLERLKTILTFYHTVVDFNFRCIRRTRLGLIAVINQNQCVRSNSIDHLLFPAIFVKRKRLNSPDARIIFTAHATPHSRRLNADKFGCYDHVYSYYAGTTRSFTLEMCQTLFARSARRIYALNKKNKCHAARNRLLREHYETSRDVHLSSGMCQWRRKHAARRVVN